jgi:hypothetical protein
MSRLQPGSAQIQARRNAIRVLRVIKELASPAVQFPLTGRMLVASPLSKRFVIFHPPGCQQVRLHAWKPAKMSMLAAIPIFR